MEQIYIRLYLYVYIHANHVTASQKHYKASNESNQRNELLRNRTHKHVHAIKLHEILLPQSFLSPGKFTRARTLSTASYACALGEPLYSFNASA